MRASEHSTHGFMLRFLIADMSCVAPACRDSGQLEEGVEWEGSKVCEVTVESAGFCGKFGVFIELKATEESTEL